MSASTQRVGSVLVLTEDSGTDAHDTIIAVVKRMLSLVVPGYQSHRLGIAPKDHQALKTISGTGWKSTDPRRRDDITTMFRTVATRLRTPYGFVLFHIDGDRPWSDRTTSENVTKFREIVVSGVRRVLVEAGDEPAVADTRLQRLRLLVPYYCIESWLYQHTRSAVDLCTEKHQGRDVAVFEAWARDRTLLDEVTRPKEVVCLGSRYNPELAGAGYPADSVFAADRSYAASVMELLACDDLVAMLNASLAGHPTA